MKKVATEFHLEKQYQYTLDSMPRGKNKTTPVEYRCNIPHRVITIDDSLNCLLCMCDGWLPIPVGQVNDFDSIEEVFNCTRAKIIQSDVDDKKYTWCAIEHCGIKNNDCTQSNYQLVINIDRSCNLQCPSCRRDKYLVTQGDVYEKKLNAAEKILSWIDKFQHPIDIVATGDGDPLASLIMRPIIKNFKPKANQTMTLKTNGLLIKKQLRDTNLLNNINDFKISVDAGSSAVYEKVRLGGSWKVLIENFNFLKDNNRQTDTQLDFILQNDNYEDLENFVNLCEEYKFTGTVSRLNDWGTWINEKVSIPDSWTVEHGYYFDHNVLDENHPNFNKCKDIVGNFKNHSTVHIDQNILDKLGL